MEVYPQLVSYPEKEKPLPPLSSYQHSQTRNELAEETENASHQCTTGAQVLQHRHDKPRRMLDSPCPHSRKTRGSGRLTQEFCL